MLRRFNDTATQRRGYIDSPFISALRADPPELEGCLGFYDLAVHLQQWIGEKIDRSALRLRIDDQIAALRQLKPIGGIMTKIVISKLRVFP